MRKSGCIVYGRRILPDPAIDFSPFLPNPTRFSSFFPLANSTLWLWQTMIPPLYYSKYLFGWPLCLSKCLSRVLPCCSTQFSNTCFSIGLIRWENLLLYAPVPSRTCITGGPVSLSHIFCVFFLGIFQMWRGSWCRENETHDQQHWHHPHQDHCGWTTTRTSDPVLIPYPIISEEGSKPKGLARVHRL